MNKQLKHILKNVIRIIVLFIILLIDYKLVGFEFAVLFGIAMIIADTSYIKKHE